MDAAPRDFQDLPSEQWGEAWLKVHDQQYIKPKAPRRTSAREPYISAITEPLTNQAKSGDSDLDSVHLGGKLTREALRQRRVAPGVRRMEPVSNVWGARRGNGRDGVLRRAIDHEWVAACAGQIELTGDGFTSPPSPRPWPASFACFWPPQLPKGQLSFAGHGFTLGVRP